MKKLRVGIIGSCVSRLAFRSDFIPESKPFFDVIQYQFHTSLISVMAQPIKYDYSKFKGREDEYAKEHLASELDKDGLNNLVASNPDILLIDFYPDVHFGISYTEHSIITNKCWRYKRIEAFNELDIKGHLDPITSFDEYFKIWKENLSKFIEFMTSYLPNTKIIIIGARFAELQNIDGVVSQINSEFDLAKRNKVWNIFDKYAVEAYKLDYLDLTSRYMATNNHTHGLDPLQFERTYYSDFIIKLFNCVYSCKARNLSSLELLEIDQSQFLYQKGKNAKKWNLLDSKVLNLWHHNKASAFNISDETITISVKGANKPIYNQLHSLPIEIGGRNDSYFQYKLSFDIFIKDLDELEDDSIFLLRTHKGKFTLWHKDAISSVMLKAKKLELTGGKWEHVQVAMICKDRFLRVSPYLAQNGSVQWKNIKLERVA
ncbi:DUF6270 domain-containing protein [Actinobacillus pleuropneumoniae]|uniref:DUF6270 domain-containing protein n=1 Tax=Actinobacillus pleuropneumoniae TaxID=715 RepID=A0A9Q4H6K0_ACTPL|nr:DUF6270 domain-containing protein [Actinobacillus pleuropneumoniae]MCY6524250.1 DUF6270 domain-containing protein [Actinobacillus pleuropneumoniae]